MFEFIALGIAAGIVGLLGYASRKPDAFEIRRSIPIRADAHHIFAFLDDFHRWRVWSPWEDIDADLQRSYSGPASGKGAGYAWAGKKAGAGRMEITDLSPPERLNIELDFTRPFRSSNRIQFTLEEVEGVTVVNWVMTGNNRLPTKVMSVFMSMDDLVGKDFEKGLNRLKAAAEGAGSAPANLPPTV